MTSELFEVTSGNGRITVVGKWLIGARGEGYLINDFNSVMVDRDSFNIVKYYKSLLNFINEGFPESRRTLVNADLNEDVIDLQASFYALPEEVQKRLLSIEFNVFLQADNEVDLYAYRNYILDNRNFMYHIFTISVRVEAEVNLILKLLKNHDYYNYNYVIPRNYDFYIENQIIQSKESDNSNIYQPDMSKETYNDNSIKTVNKNYVSFIKKTNKAPISTLLGLAIKLFLEN